MELFICDSEAEKFETCYACGFPFEEHQKIKVVSDDENLDESQLFLPACSTDCAHWSIEDHRKHNTHVRSKIDAFDLFH